MKSMFGGFIFIATVLWLLWSFSGKTDCEKVEHLTRPFMWAAQGLRMVSQNWIDKTDQDNAIVWTLDTRKAIGSVVARTFYSQNLNCGF